ncbi:MAG: DUF1080 domain-containing protein [Pseudomonadota bacterium]
MMTVKDRTALARKIELALGQSLRAKTALVSLAALAVTACGQAIEKNAPAIEDDDWITLFDGAWGDGLEVWISREGVFPVEDQEIFTVTDDGLIQVFGPEPSLIEDALLMTKEPFENYHFVVEYKWGTEQFNRFDDPRNSGILYHVFSDSTAESPADTTLMRMGSSENYGVPVGGPPFPDGEREEGSFGGWTRSIEYQMRLGQEGESLLLGTQAVSTIDENGNYTPLGNGVEVVTRGALNGPPFGFTVSEEVDALAGWNVAEIVVKGAEARHFINGQEVLAQHDMRVLNFDTQRLEPLTTGRVGVQAEGAELYIRSIRLLPL